MGLVANCTVAAPANAHTKQATECHGRGVAVAERIPLGCALDSGRANPGWSARSRNRADPGAGAGEAGARPALTRNCERLAGKLGDREPGPPPRSTGTPVLGYAPPPGGRHSAL